jgi:glycosyltransferase involved in cell wall biosynthesis
MDLSVVVPTLNARDELAACLDALAEHAPDAEVIVVNGPSADGTTGMVRERDTVDVLVELADRTINAARNAGIDRATGDVVAFVDHTHRITAEWTAGIESALDDAAGATGPSQTQQSGTKASDRPESGSIAGREVTYFDPGNVAFARQVLDDLDGFDEYLDVGGSKDLAHRIAASEYDLVWATGMETTGGLSADGGDRETDLHWTYRSLSYRLLKNYGLRPTVVRRLATAACADAYAGLRDIFGGEREPTWWFGSGRNVIAGLGTGSKDGLLARRRDNPPRRNPHGRSARTDRAVTVYDWR